MLYEPVRQVNRPVRGPTGRPARAQTQGNGAVSPYQQLLPMRNVQLAEDAGEMMADGHVVDAQPLRDALVSEALTDQDNDVSLAPR